MLKKTFFKTTACFSLLSIIFLSQMNTSWGMDERLEGRRCFRLSLHPQNFSRTPEVLCIMNHHSNQYLLTLTTGLFNDKKEVARFNFDLLQRARCMDCNEDVYGLSSPSNSSFNALKVKFKGKVYANQKEAGTVTIGANRFFYRAIKN